VSLDEIGRVAALLSGQARAVAGTGKILETGIKVIDVICPLAAGGTVAVAGGIRAGIVVLAEEIVRRLSAGAEEASLFVLVPPPSPENPIYHGKTLADQLHEAGCGEGTVGAIQTFFLRSGCEPWTKDRLSALTHLDTVIHLSRECASANIYPPVDVLTSRSRLLEEKLVSADHAAIADEVRRLLAELWVLESVRGLYQGLHSFRNMRRMEASLRNARALRLRFSQSLANRRQRFNQAMVRSTIQRLGSGTNPLARSERLTISVLRLGRILSSAVSKIGPA